MTSNHSGRELQSENGDWIARQFLSESELKKSPEEYAAQHAHLWGSFSLHMYKYQDPALGAWVRRVGEILSSEEEIERCRRQFLSAHELENVRTQANEPI